MSIWSSWSGIDCFYCKRGCSDCEGVGLPYVYDNSAILPNRIRPRDGWVSLASLSRFVRYYCRYPNGANPPDGIEPWLRLDVNDSTVVLDRAQVETLAARLGFWLDETERGAT